ncbi:MAG: hypothetical protein RXS25_13290, partial [Paraburkholderia sp.]|uniref:hypothetical protein n=1 Tax=Paraburkholderia sp. TaxID=1926495 RepID=UPI00397CD6A2
FSSIVSKPYLTPLANRGFAGPWKRTVGPRALFFLVRYTTVGAGLDDESIVHHSVPAPLRKLPRQIWVISKPFRLEFRYFVIFLVIDKAIADRNGKIELS